MLSKIKIFLILILALAFFLRFYKLTAIPASLNPDEKFNGYMAYSLLKTGRDERGNLWPLTIRSFGSWTLLGTPLLTVPFVAVLGLNELAVKLPVAAMGVVSTYLIFKVAHLLFRSFRTALLAGLFFAVSPWAIYLGRISHETTVGLTLVLAGLASFLSGGVLLAAVFFGLSLLTHFAYVIFTPLFVGGLIFIYRDKIKITRRNLLAGVIFAAVFLTVALIILQGSIGELSDVGIFNNRDILYGRVERFRGDGSHAAGDWLLRFHTKYLGIPYQLAQNYAAVFSPAFLFDKGAEALMHNLGYFGELYLFDAVFLTAGIIFLAKEKNSRTGKILLVWGLIGPLASIFTKDNPSATRLFPLAGFFVLLSAFGAGKLFRRKIGIIGGCGAFIILVLWFLDAYFMHLNVQRARFWNYGYKQAVEISNLPQYQRNKVVMVGTQNFAYISFLFYNRYDPDQFRREVVYYPLRDNGFQFVKSFGRYTFVEKIDYTQLDPNTLYIDYAGANETKNLIRLPGGDPLFTYFTK